MKNRFKILAFLLVFALVPFALPAQNPPHPNGGNAPDPGSNTPVGGGAPLDGGLIVMAALGAMYASRKIAGFKKED